MNRTISYDIDSHSEGLRVEQFLRRKGYSAQNLSTIKRMPESILVNGVHYYMKQTLKAGDRLLVRIQETESSRNIPPVCAPLSVVYEDEDLIVINKTSRDADPPFPEQLYQLSGQCPGLVLPTAGETIHLPVLQPA